MYSIISLLCTQWDQVISMLKMGEIPIYAGRELIFIISGFSLLKVFKVAEIVISTYDLDCQ